MEAVNRTMRARFTLWRAGRFTELWERVSRDHANRSPSERKQDEEQLLREARRVASLVDQGLLSRAAAQLCSRRVAPQGEQTLLKVENLFPAGSLPLKTTGFEAPAFEIDSVTVKKAVLSSHKGLAAVLGSQGSAR